MEFNEAEDETEAAPICDYCGEEFGSRAALEGHESEGCWADPDKEDLA